jgi:cation-transporting ATPase 13A3/4/5
VPFVVTIVVALLVSSYLLFDPSAGVAKLMQLTRMDWDFKTFILVLGLGYVAVAWTSEHYIFPRLARHLGTAKTYLSGKPKKRKAYKIILQEMRALQ